MNNLNNQRFLKQYQGIPWVGALQVQISNSMLYVSAINTFMLAMTFWYTTGSPLTSQYAPWIHFWTFAGIVILVMLTVMLLDYKYLYPARLGFTNRQTYKHDNPAVDDLKLIKEKQRDLEEKLDKILIHLGAE